MSLAADGVDGLARFLGVGSVGVPSVSATEQVRETLTGAQRLFTDCSFAVRARRSRPSDMTIVDPNTRGEQSRVADAASRLRTRFPQLSAEEVARAVELSHRELDDAPVRDFVPLLVEKRARELLTGSLSRDAT